jgi:hypothetical protein
MKVIRLYEVFYMANIGEIPKERHEMVAEDTNLNVVGEYVDCKTCLQFHKNTKWPNTDEYMFVEGKRCPASKCISTPINCSHELLSLTEPAYSAEDAAKQVEMRMKDDRDFIKICQVKPRQEIFRRVTYKEYQMVRNKLLTRWVELL